MRPLTTTNLVYKRSLKDWKLMLSIFVGILAGVSLIAGAPVYLNALERQSISSAIDAAVERSSGVFLDITTSVPFVPLSDEKLQETERLFEDAVQKNIAPFHLRNERYVQTAPLLVSNLSPPSPYTDSYRGNVYDGYFQSLSGLEQHVTLLQGRMARSDVLRGTQGPMIEAVIGAELAEMYSVQTGQVVAVKPFVEDPITVSARIVGIAEATDPSDEYWQNNASDFINPNPLSESRTRLPIPDDESPPPPLAMFVTQNAMVNAVGRAYPGTAVDSTWFSFIDEEALKLLPGSEIERRISGFQNDVAVSLPGSSVRGGIRELLEDFSRRSFLSSIPLLLLLAVLSVTVIYFLFMAVSYLAPSRETDVARYRSRGAGNVGLLKEYMLEGMTLTVVAVVLAPFIAMGAVAMVGALPYFGSVTGGAMLPVELSWMPFAASGGAGLLSLAIFVIPGVAAGRAGIVAQKLRAARPPSVPFLQRYYIDLGLLAIGGALFWEIQARGQLVSGGLLGESGINEALLVSPVLFLIATGLLFFRLFPMFVRFISGESATLVHLFAITVIVVLGVLVATRELSNGNISATVQAEIALFALILLYASTIRARNIWTRSAGLFGQAAIIGLFIWLRPFPEPEDFLFILTIGLALIAPAQLLFLILAGSMKVAPIWVLMVLRHMARNPLQYSWLVLLLVLSTGVGILATTVGGTLSRNAEERVLYNVASDFRLTGLNEVYISGNRDLKEEFGNIRGVNSVSMAFRGSGNVGSNIGGGFDVLALETATFRGWYRDDFSAKPLDAVLQNLRSEDDVEPIIIPEGAADIGVWVKPSGAIPLASFWLKVEDEAGKRTTLTFGGFRSNDWHLMRREIPPRMRLPAQITSVQINEPGFGAVATPGSVLIDDIFVTFENDETPHLLEGFESGNNWTPIATSSLSSDALSFVTQDVHGGVRAASFSFGKETNKGIRGIYRSAGSGFIPVVASSSFAATTGAGVGSGLVVDISGTSVGIEIKDIVDYFPTMDPGGRGFVVADIDPVIAALDIVNLSSRTTPNELFMTVTPGSESGVREAAVDIVGRRVPILDRSSSLRELSLNPLINAGWRAMMLLSLGVIVFTVGLGYLIYLLSFADNSRGEIASLQSMGLSRFQTFALVGLEHLMIVLIGLALGTWAGFQMSRMIVSSVAVSDTGGAALPPFVLTTDWTFMLPIYVILSIIFVLSIASLTRSMYRRDLHMLSRLET